MMVLISIIAALDGSYEDLANDRNVEYTEESVYWTGWVDLDMLTADGRIQSLRGGDGVFTEELWDSFDFRSLGGWHRYDFYFVWCDPLPFQAFSLSGEAWKYGAAWEPFWK